MACEVTHHGLAARVVPVPLKVPGTVPYCIYLDTYMEQSDLRDSTRTKSRGVNRLSRTNKMKRMRSRTNTKDNLLPSKRVGGHPVSGHPPQGLPEDQGLSNNPLWISVTCR